MNKYFLIGIPDCGKSTLGRRAAEVLRMPFFDTDTMVYERMNLSHPVELFRMALNGKFLEVQSKIIAELAELDTSAIIATGAEVALMPDCAALMQTMGTVIHINRSPEAMLEGMKKSGKRGLVMREMKSGKEIDMQKEAVRLYAEESSRYEALADLTLENNGTEEEGLEKLLVLITK